MISIDDALATISSYASKKKIEFDGTNLGPIAVDLGVFTMRIDDTYETFAAYLYQLIIDKSVHEYII